MLGFIKGKVISRAEDGSHCVLLAHRLGFEIILPASRGLGITVGDIREFWLHTHVREDVLALYGFESDSERQFFRMLLGISGLGPKTALALIGTHGIQRLVDLIGEKRASEIAEAPGVGKRLAERLVLELSGKAERLALFASASPRVTPPVRMKLREDLSSALLNLGYPSNSVKGALDSLFESRSFEGVEFEEVLKASLKEIYIHRRDA